MFWKFFGISAIFFAYAWFIEAGETKSFYHAGEKIYKYICKTAEEHDIRLHIHTRECFLDDHSH